MRMPKLAELVDVPFVGPVIAAYGDLFGLTDDDLPDIIPDPRGDATDETAEVCDLRVPDQTRSPVRPGDTGGRRIRLRDGVGPRAGQPRYARRSMPTRLDRRTMSRLTGCPGAGNPPSRQGPVGTIETDAAGGKAICSRCGGLQQVRKDGRIKAHRVDPSVIIPAIGGRQVLRGLIFHIESERR